MKIWYHSLCLNGYFLVGHRTTIFLTCFVTPSCPFREFCFLGIAAFALESSSLNSLKSKRLGRLWHTLDGWWCKPAHLMLCFEVFAGLETRCTVGISVANRWWNGSDLLRVILSKKSISRGNEEIVKPIVSYRPWILPIDLSLWELSSALSTGSRSSFLVSWQRTFVSYSCCLIAPLGWHSAFFWHVSSCFQRWEDIYS